MITEGDTFSPVSDAGEIAEVLKVTKYSKTSSNPSGIWLRVRVKKKNVQTTEFEVSQQDLLDKNKFRCVLKKEILKVKKRKRSNSMDSVEPSRGRKRRSRSESPKRCKHWDSTVKSWPRIGDDYQASIPKISRLKLNDVL